MPPVSHASRNTNSSGHLVSTVLIAIQHTFTAGEKFHQAEGARGRLFGDQGMDEPPRWS